VGVAEAARLHRPRHGRRLVDPLHLAEKEEMNHG
jgi:hypothetical protein